MEDLTQGWKDKDIELEEVLFRIDTFNIKQQWAMKVFFKLKMGVRKQNLTIEEFFEAYKASKKMLSSYITQ